MKTPSNRPARSADLEKLNRGDKRKLIVMGALLVLVAAAWFISVLQKEKHESVEQQELPEIVGAGDGLPIAVPTFDAAKLTETVRDHSEEARLSIAAKALDGTVELVRRLLPEHYVALGSRVLTAELAAELESDPGAHRLAPYLLRGTLDADTLRTQSRGGGRQEEVVGLMTLEDGTRAWVIVLNTPELVSMKPFLRVDGLFLQRYRYEVGAAGWVDAPLFVGANAVRSYPPLGPVDEFPTELAEEVEDDDARSITPVPFEYKWTLMAYARDLDPDSVDWENAAELDNLTMTEILKNGDDWRGKPVRVPISKNMGSWVETAGENPARIDKVTLGWIGNWTWTNNAGVIHYVAPFAKPELQRAGLVEGRGFLIKNLAYEPKNGGMRVAPYFVLAEVSEFITPEDHSIDYILMAVGALTVGMILLFWFLLMRGKREAAALQRELVRRRRARQGRDTEGGGLSQAPAES